MGTGEVRAGVGTAGGISGQVSGRGQCYELSREESCSYKKNTLSLRRIFQSLDLLSPHHGGSELRSWIRTGPDFGPGMLVKSFLSAGVEIGPLIIDFEFPFSTRI